MLEPELKELVANNINKIEADLIFLEKDHTIKIKEKENERECVMQRTRNTHRRK